MKNFSLADALDTLFYPLAAGLAVFGLLRFTRLSFPLCLLFSILFALCCAVFCVLFIGGRRKKAVAGKREMQRRDALMLHLALEKEERVRAALLCAFKGAGKEVNCCEDGLIYEGKRLVAVFTMQPVSADEIARLVRKFGREPFTVACNALSPEAERLLRSFGNDAMCADEVYDLFVKADAFPEPLICGDIPRKTIRTRIRSAFSQKNARLIFVSGLLLLIMSLFVYFPLYYLISGSVLVCCAVCVRLFGTTAQP